MTARRWLARLEAAIRDVTRRWALRREAARKSDLAERRQAQYDLERRDGWHPVGASRPTRRPWLHRQRGIRKWQG